MSALASHERRNVPGKTALLSYGHRQSICTLFKVEADSLDWSCKIVTERLVASRWRIVLSSQEEGGAVIGKGQKSARKRVSHWRFNEPKSTQPSLTSLATLSDLARGRSENLAVQWFEIQDSESRQEWNWIWPIEIWARPGQRLSVGGRAASQTMGVGKEIGAAFFKSTSFIHGGPTPDVDGRRSSENGLKYNACKKLYSSLLVDSRPFSLIKAHWIRNHDSRTTTITMHRLKKWHSGISICAIPWMIFVK